MSGSNVKFGQGGRLYADATKRHDADGLPWDHGSEDDAVPPLPSRVVPKAMSPAGLPPASSVRPGSLNGVATTILELVGLGMISAGFFLVSTALGLIVAGVALVLLGFAVGRGGE